MKGLGSWGSGLGSFAISGKYRRRANVGALIIKIGFLGLFISIIVYYTPKPKPYSN